MTLDPWIVGAGAGLGPHPAPAPREQVLTAFANDTRVVCVSPGHPRGAVALGLSVGGVAWLEALRYTYYEAPVLVDLYPASGRAFSPLHGVGGNGTSGGTLLRLRGFGLANWAPADYADAAGASAGYGEHLFVCRFGAGADAPKTQATRVTDKVAKCRTPSLPPGNVPVFLSLNGQDFTKAPGLAGELAFYPPPVLVPPAALSPVGGPTAGGTAVGISGSGLRPFELTSRGLSDVVCRFGDPFHADYRNLVPAIDVRDSAAVCVAPTTRVANYSYAGVTGLFEFTLSANGGLDAASDDVDFTRGVPPPLQFKFYTVDIESTWPRGGPTEGGTRVTVNGHGFTTFTSASGVRCRFDEVEVQAAPEEVATLYVVCLLPPRDEAGAVTVTVSLNGVDYDGPLDGSPLLFTYYLPPRIAYLEPPGGPVLGGALVSLHGSHLASFGLERTHPAEPAANESAICSGPGSCCNTPCPSLLVFYGLDASQGGGFMANGHGRQQLVLVRGRSYMFALDNAAGSPPVIVDNPLLLSIDPVGGPAAETMLVTTVRSHARPNQSARPTRARHPKP